MSKENIAVYLDKLIELLKRKEFICDEPRFEEMFEDLNDDEKEVMKELSTFWNETCCDYTSAKHMYSIMRVDEKIKLGYADASLIIKYGDELLNISMFRMHDSNTDYHNTDKYYYGCSISDDAKRHNNYFDVDAKDIIDFYTDNKNKGKVLQKTRQRLD